MLSGYTPLKDIYCFKMEAYDISVKLPLRHCHQHYEHLLFKLVTPFCCSEMSSAERLHAKK